MENNNPYSALIERIKKHVPSCKLRQGGGMEESCNEINRCFDIIDSIIYDKQETKILITIYNKLYETKVIPRLTVDKENYFNGTTQMHTYEHYYLHTGRDKILLKQVKTVENSQLKSKEVSIDGISDLDSFMEKLNSIIKNSIRNGKRLIILKVEDDNIEEEV